MTADVPGSEQGQYHSIGQDLDTATCRHRLGLQFAYSGYFYAVIGFLFGLSKG